MQTGNPNLYRLVLYVPIPVDRQAEEVERAIHERFSAKRCRSNGEWFDLNATDIVAAATDIMRLIAPVSTLEAPAPNALSAITIPRASRLTYSKKELTELLGISPVTIWRLEKKKILMPIPDMRHKLYATASVDKFLRRTAA